jgi:hypothetical protein
MAAVTSATESPRPASARGSSHTWNSRRRPPWIWTWDTPGIRTSAGLSVNSASWSRKACERVFEVRA